VKALNQKDDRDKEVACYNALKSFQGVAIPVLLDADYEYFDQEFKHGLILSWVGAEFGGNFIELPRSALLEAQKIVASMHANGMVHRDLRPENISYNFTTGKLFLYDFSHSATRTSISAKEFEHARTVDLSALEKYIKISETPAAVEEIEWAADWVRRTRKESGAAAKAEGRLLR
jgi:tRNA A-37 threonylcarbamoyl transferase component Bud32